MGVSLVMVLQTLPSLALGPSIQSDSFILQRFTFSLKKSSLRTFGGIIKESRELVLTKEAVKARTAKRGFKIQPLKKLKMLLWLDSTSSEVDTSKQRSIAESV